ncbi:putative peptide chain release factor c12orf65 [Holotrichia oblita]|uniref:Peptide chain release factor c12orf65 n=1 Tax=Holotrichia oblita TaxID=644536 RepID=A0ACB9SLF3_HOLOL|nr:putative peptide chain release factor c12orf65 [Holotrichia oblita]
MYIRYSRKLFENSFLLIRTKYTIDYSRVPKLIESELEEQHVRGSGPGGQATNKTANAVILKHIPTGIVVKCHQDRSLHINKKRARSILLTKLDNFLNNENSIESQIKAIEKVKSTAKERKKEKIRILKDEWKKRENLE